MAYPTTNMKNRALSTAFTREFELTRLLSSRSSTVNLAAEVDRTRYTTRRKGLRCYAATDSALNRVRADDIRSF